MIASLIPISILTAIFLSQNRFIQFCIFSLACLIPFSSGNFGSIPDFRVIEWLTPLFFLVTLNDFIPLKGPKTRISFSGVRIFIIAITILLIVTVNSYFQNEIFSTLSPQFKSTGTKRMYYMIFIQIMIFFSTILFLYKNHMEINFEKWLKVIFVFALVFGLIRVFAYFFDFDTPFVAGGFDYSPPGRSRFGGIAYRIGGLSDVATLGLCALLGLYHIQKKVYIIPSIIFSGLFFLSGGRTSMVGVAIAVIIYSVFFLRKYLVYIFLVTSITSLVIFIAAPDELIHGQFGRLSAFEGGVKQQDKGRYFTYTLSIENFKKNPVFGKGISPYLGYIPVSNAKEKYFIQSQLFAGGHGGYITILSTFGVLGFTYLCIMIFFGIYLSLKKIKEYIFDNPNLSALATFAFLMLVIKSVTYLTSFNGFNDTTLFFVTGLIATIRTIENKVETAID